MSSVARRLFHSMRVRPRLYVSAAAGLAVACLLPPALMPQALTRALVGWNLGTTLYIALAARMMAHAAPDTIRRRARLQDDGAAAILALVAVSAMMSLAAIAGELAIVKDLQGWIKDAHVALAGVTVLTSWGFIQVMFALHYAHKYYGEASQGRVPGLKFPDDEAPRYGDFFYFAAIIGTSGQTADVSFTTRSMRRTGTLHCVLAYLFNTVVLALLINISASLI